jgi:hypothetical protein
MTKRLKRRESFQTRQKYGDCWLYSSSTLISNYYLNMDLEINGGTIFENYDDSSCQLLFKNYGEFISNIGSIVKRFKTDKDCRPAIYYYFLFYFIYYLATISNKQEILSGHKRSLYIEYVLDIITGNNKRIKKITIDSLENKYYDHLKKKISFYTSLYTFERSTLKKIIHDVVTMIKNVNKHKDIYIGHLETNKFYHILTDEQIFKKDVLEKILSKSYICMSYDSYIDTTSGVTYHSYIDPTLGVISFYSYNCLDDPTKKFVLPNRDHVIVFEEIVESIDGDPDNFGIVIKESNSECKYTMYNKQMSNFVFRRINYLKHYDKGTSKSKSPDAHSPYKYKLALSPLVPPPPYTDYPPPPPPPSYEESIRRQPPPPSYEESIRQQLPPPLEPIEEELALGKRKRTKKRRRKRN